MTQPTPRDVLLKIRKLALLPDEVKQSRWAISVSRLTSLKSLCQQPEVANRFVAYLASKTLERVRQGKGHSGHHASAGDLAHQQMMTEALSEMEGWLQEQTGSPRTNAE
jgi:hypothetical protein